MERPEALSLSREKMYQMVWAEPMTAIATQLGVSGSYLARICTLMNVPRPERGYWAKLAAGKKCVQPPLPKARPCDIKKWQKGQPIPRQRRTYLPSKPSLEVRAPSTEIHPFLNNVEPLYLKGRGKSDGYLTPHKRNLPDIITSEESLQSALKIANRLFQALEAAGRTVRLAANTEVFYRHSPGEDVEWSTYPKRWEPGRITIACFGKIAMGLTLYEVAKDTQVASVNGKDIPISSMKRVPRGAYVRAKKYPSGMFRLQVYSPYRDSDWMKAWDMDFDNIEDQTQSIARSLQRYIKPVKLMAQKAEEERIRREEEWRKERIKWEEERKRHEARRRAKEGKISYYQPRGIVSRHYQMGGGKENRVFF